VLPAWTRAEALEIGAVSPQHHLVVGALPEAIVNEALSEPARRLLVFLMGHLGHSRHSDIVFVSRRFLPGDAGLSPEDSLGAYRALYTSRASSSAWTR
jgi:hypothetical protein